MKLEVEIDEKQFRQGVRELKHIPGGIYKALAAAIKRTTAGVKTDAVREVRAKYAVKYRPMLKAIKAEAIVTIGPEVIGEINAEYESLRLDNFPVSPRRTTGIRPKGGITVKVKKDEAKRIKSAFVLTSGQGIRVYKREGDKRGPLLNLFGPAAAQQLSNKDVNERIQRLAQQRLDNNLAHEIDRVLKGYGKKK